MVAKEEATPAGQNAGSCAPGDLNFRLDAPPRPHIDLSSEMLYEFLVAELAGRYGELDISVSKYTALAESTRDVAVIEHAVDIALYAEDYAAAARLARLWVALDEENPDPYQVLAVAALKAQDQEQSLYYLRAVMARLGGTDMQKLWLITSFLQREESRETLMMVLEELMVDYMDDAETLYGFFANVASRLQYSEKALALLERVLELEPGHEAAAVSYVGVLLQAEQTDEALSWLEKTLADKDQQGNEELRYRYARILASEEQFSKALRQFQLLEEARPDETRILYAMGLLLLQMEQFDESHRYMEQVYGVDKNNADVTYYLGQIAEQREQWSEALSWYQKVGGGNNFFAANVSMSRVLSKLGKESEAIAHLAAMQERKQGDPVVLVQYQAQILTDAGRYYESMKLLNEALENTKRQNYTKEQRFTLLYERALLAADKLDNITLAEEDLRNILLESPENVTALNALGYTLTVHTDRYEEAYSLIRKALDQSPENVYVLDSMGWVLYHLGRHNEALEYLQQAMALRADPAIAAHLGEVLWAVGQQRRARQVWEQAREEDPDHEELLKTIEQYSP